MNKLGIVSFTVLFITLLLVQNGWACTNATGGWVNCTIYYNNTDPLQAVQQTAVTNFPLIGLLLYAIIFIGSYGFFNSLNNTPLLSLSYASFLGILISITLTAYGWSSNSPNLVDLSLGLTGFSILLLYLFR